MPRTNRRSKLQFFTHVPSEIVIDILSRLPIRTVVTCKCVCRSWRDLLQTREFVDFHLSKAVPGLVIDWGSNDLRIFGFDNEPGVEQFDPQYKPLTVIDSVELTGSFLEGSANGMLLLRKEVSTKRDALYICNPITREYIELLYDRLVSYSTAMSTYGFGVSRITGQHKVVRILHERDRTLQNVTMSICLVYTLGTGIWRSVRHPAPFLYHYNSSIGVNLNGNLHWLVQVSDGSHCILRFDLETETFSTFSLPSPFSKMNYVGLAVLGDCLCVSDNASEDEVVIWVMKEYGNEKSWAEEYIVDKSMELDEEFRHCEVVHPIKVFKDGDILMALQDVCMVIFLYISKDTEDCQLFGDEEFYFCGMKAMIHTSSFFSLNSFTNERVTRF